MGPPLGQQNVMHQSTMATAAHPAAAHTPTALTHA